MNKPKKEMTEDEIVKENDALIDVYYEVWSKSWTHLDYEMLLEKDNIIHGPDYIVQDRFLLRRRSKREIAEILSRGDK